jgi:hypothetical protein
MVEAEREPHQQFVDMRAEMVYGRVQTQRRILAYVSSAETASVMLVTRGRGRRLGDEECGDGVATGAAATACFALRGVQKLLLSFLAERSMPVLLLAGEAGAGKSALLAAAVRAQVTLSDRSLPPAADSPPSPPHPPPHCRPTRPCSCRTAASSTTSSAPPPAPPTWCAFCAACGSSWTQQETCRRPRRSSSAKRRGYSPLPAAAAA